MGAGARRWAAPISTAVWTFTHRCLAYWLLTGHLVFDAASPTALLVHTRIHSRAALVADRVADSEGLDRLVPVASRRTRTSVRSPLASCPAVWRGRGPRLVVDERARGWWSEHSPAPALPRFKVFDALLPTAPTGFLLEFGMFSRANSLRACGPVPSSEGVRCPVLIACAPVRPSRGLAEHSHLPPKSRVPSRRPTPRRPVPLWAVARLRVRARKGEGAHEVSVFRELSRGRSGGVAQGARSLTGVQYTPVRLLEGPAGGSRPPWAADPALSWCWAAVELPGPAVHR